MEREGKKLEELGQEELLEEFAWDRVPREDIRLPEVLFPA